MILMILTNIFNSRWPLVFVVVLVHDLPIKLCLPRSEVHDAVIVESKALDKTVFFEKANFCLRCEVH